jgi:hypothetical protein
MVVKMQKGIAKKKKTHKKYWGMIKGCLASLAHRTDQRIDFGGSAEQSNTSRLRRN